jgi:hypothetical protein
VTFSANSAPPRQTLPECFAFTLLSVRARRSSLRVVILNRPGEGRVKDLSSAFAEVSRAKIRPRQIATRQQTESSVTYSKQRTEPQPNRYKNGILNFRLRETKLRRFHSRNPFAPGSNTKIFLLRSNQNFLRIARVPRLQSIIPESQRGQA